ncbi:aspartyl protease family protein [Patescibacteria group bacterium]
MQNKHDSSKLKLTMGIINVNLEVKNLKDETLVVEERFLVDNGATFTVLPKRMVKQLKLKPSFQQRFSLADGRVVSRKIGNALIKYKSREVATPVVLGLKEDSALLGAITLEAMGMVLDPFSRKLYRAKLML